MMFETFLNKLDELGIEHEDSYGAHKSTSFAFGNFSGGILHQNVGGSNTQRYVYVCSLNEQVAFPDGRSWKEYYDPRNMQELYDLVCRALKDGTLQVAKLEREFADAKKEEQRIEEEISKLLTQLKRETVKKASAKEKWVQIRSMKRIEISKKLNADYERIKKGQGREAASKYIHEKYPEYYEKKRLE